MAPRITALRARRGGRVLVQIDGQRLACAACGRCRACAPDARNRARPADGCAKSRASGGAHVRSRRPDACSAPRDLPAQARRRTTRTKGHRRHRPSRRSRGAGECRARRRRALRPQPRARARGALSRRRRHPLRPRTSRRRRRSWSTTRCQALEPEAGPGAADRRVRGRSPATARFLARKGFGEDAVESAAGEVLG